MFEFETVQAHVRKQIEGASLVADPFPHFYVHDLLPPDTYAELLASLPEDSEYQTYKPPYEARLFMNLKQGEVSRLHEKIRPFWIAFEEWINSQEFLDLMVSRFGQLLKTNAQHRKSQIKKVTKRGKIPIVSRTLLARDFAHFALGPHTDAKNKFITALYYLPRDTRLNQFGTSIYTPKKTSYTSWESDHHKHEDFDLVRTFQNLPNTFFAFMKSDCSFHGVEPGDYPNVGRDLIMWFPEIKSNDAQGRNLSLSSSIFEGDKQGFVSRLLARATS